MVDDVAPKQAWESLTRDPDAKLVDVRTDPEWSFVGVPDLAGAGKQAVLIPWQVYPSMQVNGGFADHLRQAGIAEGDKVFFICRTGGRSRAAAELAASAGFKHAFNVAGGFEGPPDGEGHRGTVAGWKADGLPWRQK